MTHTVGLPLTRDQPVEEASTCTTHNIHKRQTSTPPEGFEPATPASHRPQTYALDNVANGLSHGTALCKDWD